MLILVKNLEYTRNMNYKLLFTAIIASLFFTPFTGYAQMQPEGLDAQNNMDQLGNLTPTSPGARGFDTRYSGIKGSPFLYDSWVEGELYMTENRYFDQGLLFKYDAYLAEVHVKFESGQVKVLYNHEVEAFKLKVAKQPQHYVKLEIDQIQTTFDEPRYYEVVHEGQYRLVTLPFKYIQKADYRDPYSTGVTYDEFKLRDEYFLLVKGQYRKLKLNAKALAKLLPEHKSEIKTFSKANALALSNPAHLGQLLSHLEVMGNQ